MRVRWLLPAAFLAACGPAAGAAGTTGSGGAPPSSTAIAAIGSGSVVGVVTGTTNSPQPPTPTMVDGVLMVSPDSGMATLQVHRGQIIELETPPSTWEAATTSNSSVAAPTVAAANGDPRFVAISSGSATLTASSRPPACASLSPPCLPPDRLLEVTVVVS